VNVPSSAYSLASPVTSPVNTRTCRRLATVTAEIFSGVPMPMPVPASSWW
jgi:hypothetical protein